MKEHAIFTACDAKFGDFLIDHWFASLMENVDVSSLEVVVLDYGLSTAQRYYLEKHGAQVVPCKRDGHVVNLRFRDMASYLGEHAFDQVVLSDCGDIIFQSDFTPALRMSPTEFRGVSEELSPSFQHYLTDEFFSKEDRRRMQKLLRNSRMVNAGFIMGPAAKMRELGQELTRVLKSLEKFGPDQIVVNDVFHREGFVTLERTYNYVIATSSALLEVVDGKFYADGKLLCVVHNTGNVRFMRPVENFGHGPGRNQVKTDLLKALHALYTTTDGIRETSSEINKRLESLRSELNRGYENSMDQLETNWNLFLDHFRGE